MKAIKIKNGNCLPQPSAFSLQPSTGLVSDTIPEESFCSDFSGTG
jgi:hypothetical protein